jgi:hypothetical protein
LHINFQRTPNLPQQLIAGREAIYFRCFWIRRPSAMPTSRTRQSPTLLLTTCARGGKNTGLFPRTKNSMQRKIVRSGRHWCRVPGKLACRETHAELSQALRVHECAKVKIGVINNSVHYQVDEQPEAVAELIERYASSYIATMARA